MANPAVSLRAWRWYQDDATGGDPDTCTAFGPEATTQVMILPLDTDLQLRVSLDETSNRTGTATGTWQYQVNGTGGTWNDITTSSSFVRAIGAASSATDGAACTQLLSSVGGDSYENGQQTTDGTYLKTIGGKHNFWEDQCAVTLRSADFSAGDIVYVRVNWNNFDQDGTQNYARATVGSVQHEAGTMVAHAPAVTATATVTRTVAPAIVTLAAAAVTATLTAPAEILTARATASTTTASETYGVLDSMTITPGAGTYLALGMVEVDIEGGPGALIDLEVALFDNGTVVSGSMRAITDEISYDAGHRMTLVTHGVITVGDSEAIDIRWRVGAGGSTTTAYARSLVLMPCEGDYTEKTATGVTSTASTDFSVTMSGMTATTGTDMPAGTYVLLFSTTGDVAATSASEHSEVRPYVGGSEENAAFRRRVTHEASFDATKVPLYCFAVIECSGTEVVDIRWANTGDTATVRVYDRTMTLIRVAADNYWLATATAVDDDTGTSYEIVDGMTVTPGAGEYLALFSANYDGDPTAMRLWDTALHVNAVLESDSEFRGNYASSLTAGDYIVGGTVGRVAPDDSQAVAAYWKSTTTETRTANERALVVLGVPPQFADTGSVATILHAPAATAATADNNRTVGPAVQIAHAPAVTVTAGAVTRAVAVAASLLAAPQPTVQYDQFVPAYDVFLDAPSGGFAEATDRDEYDFSSDVDLTAEIWFEIDDPAPGTNQTLIAHNTGIAGWKWWIGSTGSLLFEWWDGSWRTANFGSPGLTAGKRHHLAVTHDFGANEVKAYLDGTQFGGTQSPIVTSGYTATIVGLRVGLNPLNQDQFLGRVFAAVVAQGVATQPNIAAARIGEPAAGTTVVADINFAQPSLVGKTSWTEDSYLHATVTLSGAFAVLDEMGVAAIVHAPAVSFTQTASVDVAAQLAHAPAVTATAGAVTRTVDVAAQLAHAPAPTVIFDQTASVGSAVAPWAAPAAAASPGAASRTVGVSGAILAAPAVATSTGAVSRTVDPAAALWAAPAVTVTTAATRTVGSAPTLLTAPAPALIFDQTVAVGSASFSAHAPAVVTTTTASRTLGSAAAVWHAPLAAAATGGTTKSVAVAAQLFAAPAVTVTATVSRTVGSASSLFAAPAPALIFDQTAAVDSAAFAAHAPAPAVTATRTVTVDAAQAVAAAPAVVAAPGPVSRTVDVAPALWAAPSVLVSGQQQVTINSASKLAAAPAVAVAVGAVSRSVGSSHASWHAPAVTAVSTETRSVGAAGTVLAAPAVATTVGPVTRSIDAGAHVWHAAAVTATTAGQTLVGVAAAVLHAPGVSTSVGGVARAVGSAVAAFAAPAVTTSTTASRTVGAATAVWSAPAATASQAFQRSVNAAGSVLHAPAVATSTGAATRTVEPAHWIAAAPAVSVSSAEQAPVGSAASILHAPAVTATALLARTVEVSSALLHAPAVAASAGTISRTVGSASATWAAPAVTATSVEAVTVGVALSVWRAPVVTVTAAATKIVEAAPWAWHAPAVATSAGPVSRTIDAASNAWHAPQVTAGLAFAQTRNVDAAGQVVRAPAVASSTFTRPKPPTDVDAESTTTFVATTSTTTYVTVTSTTTTVGLYE